MNILQRRCMHGEVEVVSYEGTAMQQDEVLVRCPDCGVEKGMTDCKGSNLLERTLHAIGKARHVVRSVARVKVGKRITYAE